VECSAGKLGTFVPVSNPVPQRLTAFSKNASFFQKKFETAMENCLSHFISKAICIVEQMENGLAVRKPSTPNFYYCL